MPTGFEEIDPLSLAGQNEWKPNFSISSNSEIHNSIDSFPESRPQPENENYNDRIRRTTDRSGITTAEFYITPSFYTDTTGSQQLIDTTIESSNPMVSPMSSGFLEHYQYQNLKNNLKVHLREDYSPEANSDLILFSDDNYKYPITWQPLGLAFRDGDSEKLVENKKVLESNLNLANSLVEDNNIIYKDIFNGIDDSYTVLPNKLKHDLILNEFPNELSSSYSNPILNLGEFNEQSSTFNYFGIITLPASIELYVDSIKQPLSFSTSRSIELRPKNNGLNGLSYIMEPPVAFEQTQNRNRILCQYELHSFGYNSGLDPLTNLPIRQNHMLIVLKTDLEWLTEPTRQYPVIIDPTLKIQNGVDGKGFDTYLVQGNDTEPEWTDYNFGKSDFLKISIAGPSIYSHEHLLHRAILKFPGINTIRSSAQIVSAKLILSCNNQGNMSITVFKSYDDWVEGTGTEAEPSNTGATWNNSGYNIWLGGNYDGHEITHSTVHVSSPNYYEWNIKDIVEDWVSDPINNPNNGFLLSGTDNEDVIKIFHSSDFIEPGRRPKIEIKYNHPPAFIGPALIEVPENQTVKIHRTEIFWDRDVDVLHLPDDFIDFQLWINKSVGWDDTGINESLPSPLGLNGNFSAELKFDDYIYITPYQNEEHFTESYITVRVKDAESNWQEVIIPVKVIETNDPPIIKSIGGSEDFESEVFLATEDKVKILPIVIIDTDNPDFIEKTKPKDGDIGDIDFDWEREKTTKFYITETGTIIFNPDNSLVGNFEMKITVYDTEWYKKGRKVFKRQLSNTTAIIQFVIENTNDPPDRPRILEPKTFSEFSTDETITFRGSGTDQDLLTPESTEKLVLQWILGENTPLGQGNKINSKLEKGKHLITLRVEDSEGEFREINTTVIVRNRATIDPINCSNYYSDESEDVICYYYEVTDQGVEDFRVERGSFVKYNIFDIDIEEFSSERFGGWLLINLTINENISYIVESDFRYEFSIYLVKPDHTEELPDLEGIRYLGSRYVQQYEPKSNDYYARFRLNEKNYESKGLGEFSIINRGRTLALKTHLGDLEAGEGDFSNLKSDFQIFATVKLEVEQHPVGYFEHIICYDSIGYGSKPAPYPQRIQSGNNDGNENNNLGSAMGIGIIIVIILMIIIGFLMFRRAAKKSEKDETIIIDTTKPLPGGVGMQMQMKMPMQPMSPLGMGMGGMQPQGMGRMGMPGMGMGGRGTGQGGRPMFMSPAMMQQQQQQRLQMGRKTTGIPPKRPLLPTGGKGRIGPAGGVTGQKGKQFKKKK
jgi:hypothetical protein